MNAKHCPVHFVCLRYFVTRATVAQCPSKNAHQCVARRRVCGAASTIHVQMEGGAAAVQHPAAYSCKQLCLLGHKHATVSPKRDHDF